MATTQNEFTGDSSRRRFAFTFPYIKEEDVKVSLRISNAAADIAVIDPANYTFPSATEIQLNAVAETTFQESTGAPKNAQDGNPAVTVRVFRETDIESPKAVFYPGSSVRAQDLNDNTLQALYAEQERENRAVDRIGGSVMQSDLTFQQADIVFQGQNIPPGDTNETTLTVEEPTADRTITLPNVTGTVVTTGDTNTVTSTMITDGTIVDADINASAEIAVSKLANGTARQLLQTDAAGTGVEFTSNVDIPGTLDVTGAATFDAAVTATTFTGNLTGDVTGDVTGNVTGDLTGTADFATNLAAAASITNAEQAAHTANDTTYFTTAASDARYFNISTGDTIKDGDAFPDNDTTIATTAAINDRIIDLVDNVGGFVPIANETSFPAENPDVNDGAGTIVSIAEIVTSRTPSNGTVTIANGQGSNTVTINNCGTTVLADGFGCLVETTSTLNTYNFHRLTPLATEVTTVAGNNANITTVATNIDDIVTVADDLNEGTSEIETVAGSIANVNNVGNDIDNVNTVAANLAEVNNFADVYQINNGDPTTRSDGSALVEGDLVYRTDTDVIRVFDGTDYANITPDQATLNDINIVADDLASFEDLGSIADDLVANQTGGALETCADNITDIRAVEDIDAEITTVAGISADVEAVADRATEISRLGTADAVADMAILGTNDVVADMAILATNDVVADMAILGTNDVVADMAILGTNDVVADMAILGTNDVVADMAILATNDVVADMNTLATADIVADMNTLATADNVTAMGNCSDDIANINTVADSIDDVNRYANEYTISANAPGSPSEGDLWYDDTNNVLKFYNGSSFASISAGISQIADDTSPEISTSATQLDMNSKNITEVGTISGNNMAMDFGSVTDT